MAVVLARQGHRQNNALTSLLRECDQARAGQGAGGHACVERRVLKSKEVSWRYASRNRNRMAPARPPAGGN